MAGTTSSFLTATTFVKIIYYANAVDKPTTDLHTVL